MKKRIPDVLAAARSVLNDWNTGKIKYCTEPPEEKCDDPHISAAIVHEDALAFNVDGFEAMETEILNKFDVKEQDVMKLDSTGPVESKIRECGVEDDKEEYDAVINETSVSNKRRRCNQTLNSSLKQQMKKRKKQSACNEKKVNKIVQVLDGFTLNTSNDEKYDFDTDYVIE
uniref:Uncharacterized protein n=1 Tax=Glossina palpalis gambiensis TaxID=67801 RepID=A0A1B0BXM8_9MUSC